MSTATEVLFYHLERQPLDRILPNLVERTLERGWRAVVQAGSTERLEAIDTLLWTWKDDSFIPHGTGRDGNPELQPVFLATNEDNPNGAAVRFLVDGATIDRFDGYVRVVVLFDGADEAAVGTARHLWKAVKSAGLAATYWQQGENGRWEKRA
ncbi:MAG TPA: DNA polymerase III subunit chi [Hyphomicrobiaceae bacterium]|nr:DNA polymerase III subunit chi [Hyphomicrobiaceae bacterium]